MSSSVPSLKPARELFDLAQRGPGGRLPDETHQSLPIPLAAAGRVPRVAFLFAPSRLVFGAGLFLITPTRRAVLDASTGEALGLDRVTPADLGVADAPGKELGRFGLPKDVSSEEFLKAREKLFGAYDRVLGPWYAGEGAPEAGRSIRAAAAELRRTFAIVGEPPLAPYYAAVGKGFFSWVIEVAGPG